MKFAISSVVVFAGLFVAAAKLDAQIASGGQFTLVQTVTATGGGSMAGGAFAVDGTSGQSIAGQRAAAGLSSIHAGFWNGPPLSTTAAGVTVSGRVQTEYGSGIRNVRVTLVPATGPRREVVTGSFGYFQFEDVAVGETYILSVAAKRYQFAAPVRVITVTDEISGLDFTADPL